MDGTEPDLDTHICLICNSTIIGLDSYVRHKKFDCPAKKCVPEKSSAGVSLNIEVSSVNISLLSSSLLSPSSNRLVDPNVVLCDSNRRLVQPENPSLIAYEHPGFVSASNANERIQQEYNGPHSNHLALNNTSLQNSHLFHVHTSSQSRNSDLHNTGVVSDSRGSLYSGSILQQPVVSPVCSAVVSPDTVNSHVFTSVPHDVYRSVEHGSSREDLYNPSVVQVTEEDTTLLYTTASIAHNSVVSQPSEVDNSLLYGTSISHNSTSPDHYHPKTTDCPQTAHVFHPPGTPDVGANGDTSNMVDFLSSLGLQSQSGQEVSKGLGDTKESPPPTTPDSKVDSGLLTESNKNDFLDHKSLKIVSILNELDFSSDSDFLPSDPEEFLNEFTDSDDEDLNPPHHHTGGKWKPGTRPLPSHTKGKWRPSGKLEAYRGKSPHGAVKGKLGSTPPSSGGKWKPGEKQHPRRGKNLTLLVRKEKEKRDNISREKKDGGSEETEKSYKCEPCDISFPRFVTLKRHLLSRKHSSNLSLAQSRKNDSRKMVEEQIEESAESAAEPTKYLCQPCDRQFSTKGSYDRHCTTDIHFKNTNKMPTDHFYAKKKKKDEDIECPACDKVYNNKYNFVRHLISSLHHRRTKGKGNSFLLDEKFQILLLRQSSFQCHVCAFYCNTQDVLVSHLKSTDHNEKAAELLGRQLCVRCRYLTAIADEMIAHVGSVEHKQTIADCSRPCIIKECRNQVTCRVCGKIEHSASRMAKHMTRHHQNTTDGDQTGSRPCKRSRDKPRCPYCDKQWPSISALAIHIRRRHTKEKPFKCWPCGVSFADSSTLKLHSRSRKHIDKAIMLGDSRPSAQKNRCTSGLRVSQCAHCEYAAKEQSDLKSHYSECHPELTYNCDICGMTYINKKIYETHLTLPCHKAMVELVKNSADEPSTCPVCNKKFYDVEKFRVHWLTHKAPFTENAMNQSHGEFHGVDPKYHPYLKQCGRAKKATCPECNKTMRMANLISHLRSHSGSLPFHCMYCAKGFTSGIQLRRHIKMHLNIKEHRCDICRKAFRKRVDLLTHKLNVHRDKTSVTPGHVCVICNRGFMQKHQLTQHMQLHLGKKHVCPWEGCGRTFVHACNVTYHMRVHTDERPYLCDQCGYAGKNQQQLTRHRRTHTGERNFHCDYCTYRAATGTHLHRHMRIHIGTKPYKCPYCTYSCNTHENMRKHIKNTRKHKGMPVYPCPDCSFGTDSAAELRQHSAKHGKTAMDVDVLSAFTGLYKKENDIKKVPEGQQVIQIKERKKVSDNSKIGTGKSERLDHSYYCDRDERTVSGEVDLADTSDLHFDHSEEECESVNESDFPATNKAVTITSDNQEIVKIEPAFDDNIRLLCEVLSNAERADIIVS